jgi:hypothetical protein
VGALVTMRRYVAHMVLAERTTAELVDWAVFYPQRDGVFLAEYVDRRGLHAFELAGTAETVATLAAWVGLFEADCPDLDVTLTADQIAGRPAALDPVTQTLVATTVTRFGADRPPGAAQAVATNPTTQTVLVYAGPAGSYTAEPAGDAVRYRGVDAHELAAVLGEVLG